MKKTLLPILILAAAALACSLVSDSATEQAATVLPPAIASQPTDAPLGEAKPLETNLARLATVTATQSLPGFEPEKAVDGMLGGESWWSAGAGAPQRIEIDLGGAYDLARIRLVVSQDPPGETLHLVFGRREGEDSQVQLGLLAGETRDGDALELVGESPWRGIRFITVQTVKSPSWVAWREIEIYGVPGNPAADAGTHEPAETQAPQAPLLAADWVFTNATILTMAPDLPIAEAIAVRGDRVLAVGTASELDMYTGPETLVVDLSGRVVTPGFIDSHSHRIGDRWLYGYGDQGPEQVIQDAIEGGWTTLHELFVEQGRLDELVSLDAADSLRVRVSMYLTMNFHFDRDDWWTAYQPLQQYSPYLQIAGLKITLDQEWGETVFFNQQQLTDMVLVSASDGWQVATHAFTPETDGMVLDAYGAAIQAHPGKDFRYRLEHIGVITDEEIQEMAALGVIGSVQFLNTAGYVDDASFSRQIPENQRELVSRWRDLIDAGVLLIGNVDAPWCCTPWRDPEAPTSTAPVMTAIYHAVTRNTLTGRVPEPWQVAQTVSVAEALEMLTIRGAYAAHQEDVLGSLEPGKYADLVVLSANPLDASVEDLPAIEVLLTMIGGKTEYCPPGQGEICP